MVSVVVRHIRGARLVCLDTRARFRTRFTLNVYEGNFRREAYVKVHSGLQGRAKRKRNFSFR